MTWPGHQPVEQHADAGEVLLDGRRGAFPAQLLDIGGDMHRLHVGERVMPLLLAPAQEQRRRRGHRPRACSCCGY